MENYCNPLLDGLKRGIVLEGLEVIYSGGDFRNWIRLYPNHQEIIVPGELEYLRRFEKYVTSHGFFRNMRNPRKDSHLVDEVCINLG